MHAKCGDRVGDVAREDDECPHARVERFFF